MTEEDVRRVIREEIGAALLRIASAFGAVLGAAAQPAPDLPPLPDDFDAALQLVNGADPLALGLLEESEANGRNRDGVLEAIRFRRAALRGTA